MALETGTYISDLVATNPTAADPKSQGDDHLRLIKSTLQATFPHINGAVTLTLADLNALLNAATTGATIQVTTQPLTDNSSNAASTAFVVGIAFKTTLPAQSGNAGKFVTTDGTNASWAYASMVPSVVSATTQTAAAASNYLLTNAAATTVTAPATPADQDMFAVTPLNSLTTNAVDFGTATYMGPFGSGTGVFTLDAGPQTFEYSSSLSKWVML